MIPKYNFDEPYGKLMVRPPKGQFSCIRYISEGKQNPQHYHDNYSLVLILSGRFDAKKRADELQKQMRELSEEKAYLLTEHNYAMDYMEHPYTCEKCKDTGTLDNGERCSCFSEKLSQM